MIFAALLLTLAAAGATGQAHTLYVARRSWHVDVGFSVTELDSGLKSIADRFPQARFIFFGFGARRYLLSEHHSSGNLSAALVPGAGLILVTAIDSSPEQAFAAAHVVRVEVTDAERDRLESQVAAAFESDARGLKTREPGPYDASLYVEAVPRYSALHTCNTWAAEIMQRSGLPISSRGVIFAGQLWSRVHRMRARPAAP